MSVSPGKQQIRKDSKVCKRFLKRVRWYIEFAVYWSEIDKVSGNQNYEKDLEGSLLSFGFPDNFFSAIYTNLDEK